jgi:pimeloyl-ACP methyl ester carboxylesterase
VPEGFVPFRGYRTWYRITGERAPGTLPLLCLHGGPGSSSAYHERLEPLAADRQVIRYDQLGCGDSDRPDDDSLWTLDLFVSEVQAVRDALGLDRVHLLGTSWGGMLAQEYALTPPRESRASSSRPRSRAPSAGPRRPAAAGRARARRDRGAVQRRSLLPPRSEAAGAGDVEGEAQREGVQRDVGPNEWTCTGRLAGWSTSRAARRDPDSDAGPPRRVRHVHEAVARELVEGIDGAEEVVFEHSSHARDRGAGALPLRASDFLGRVEASL